MSLACIDEEFVSILTLFFYTRRDDFEKDIHLIFLMENYPEMLMDGINLIKKAQIIENQYNFTDKISMLAENFGRLYLEGFSVNELELLIEEKIENIISLDIAILKFISSVPNIVEKNGLKLPGNFNVDYLIGEYLSMQERQIIAKLAKTFDIYESADACNIFEAVPKNKILSYTHDTYIRQLKRERLYDSSDEEDELDKNQIQFTEFYTNFMDICKVKSSCNISQVKLLKHSFVIEYRQLLFTMSVLFGKNTSDTYSKLRTIFLTVDNNKDNSRTSKARKTESIIKDMSIDDCREYSTYSLILIIYFMTVEYNNESLEGELIQIRNKMILLLSRMLDCLLEYIHFRANEKKENKVIYSKLPIVEDNVNAKEKPITFMMYMIQYTLDFAPFINNAI